MPLSNAEKQRRYKERLKDNPEKKEQIRKKNLDRINKKAKKVKEMTEEEKNNKRIIWRNQKRMQKEKRKEKQERNKIEEVKKKEVSSTQRELFYQRRLKKVRVSYKQSLIKLEKLQKIIARLRKRVFREKNKHNDAEKTLNKLLLSKDTEIDLLTTRNEVLENTLKTVYKAGNKISKRRIKSHVINDRKGNCSSRSRAKLLGLKYLREHKKKAVTQKLQIAEEVTRFFVRDDISRITAGKKECRTQDKDRKQIRYLTDTLTNLYSIYKSEGGKYSFTTFFQYKPFYVLSPTLQSRQTCMCIKHSNVDFLLKALKSNNMIDRGLDLKNILTRIVCNINSHECMYNQCSKCLNNKIELKNNSEEVKWSQWESVKHTYYKKSENGQNKLIETRKMTKQIKTGTASEIIQLFNKHITEFKKHYFNMKTQQSQYQRCMHQLGPHEIMIICDFSENYGCKLSDEIQAMHFGASRQQITLHCGVVYFKDRSQSFCSISDDLCHEPAAIWAHLIPVIVYVKNLGSDIKVIHFYSDGPSSQYRQKKNFYLQSLFAAKLHLDYITWSYTESGHGKGVADGIGGSVKRNLDRQVTYGRDIKNAEDAHISITKVMQSVKCFLITPNEVDNMKKLIPNNLKPIQGTSGVHQVITTPENNVILYRVLSCFCGTKPGTCSCYNPKKHLLTPRIGCSSAIQTNRLTRSTVNNTVHEEVATTTANLRPKSTTEINKSQHLNQPAQPTNTLPEVRDNDENGVSLDVEAKTDIDLLVDNIFSGEKLNFNLLYDDVLPDWIEDNVPQNRDDAVAPSLSEDEVIKISPLSANVSPKRHAPLCEPSTSKGQASKRIDAQLNLMAPKQKRMKVLLPEQKENRNSSRSLKTVVTRNFICQLCNLRQLFYKNNTTQCISCKKIVCRACTGKVHSIDYICDRCFESD